MYRKKTIYWIVIVLLTAISCMISGMNHHVEAEQKQLSTTVTVLVDLNGGNINGNTEFALIGKPGESVILEKPVHGENEFVNYRCYNGTLTVDDVGNIVYTFGNTNTVITAIWKEDMKTSIPIETPIITTGPAVEITEMINITQLPNTTEFPKEEIPDMEMVIRTAEPSDMEMVIRTAEPSDMEMVIRTAEPSDMETVIRTAEPSDMETVIRTVEPSDMETVIRTAEPSDIDGIFTTEKPTDLEPLLKTAVPFSNAIAVKKTKISLEKNIYYTTYKKKIKPKLKITYNGKKLIENKDYKLIYNKDIHYGKVQLTIKGIGDYTGKTIKNYYILPAKTKITKCKIVIKNKGRIIKMKWKKLEGVDGYQILYTTQKKKDFKEISKKSKKQISAAFWFSGKEVYIKVRPYVIIDGKYKYGESSKVKGITIKD